jgi:hypothetical protein
MGYTTLKEFLYTTMAFIPLNVYNEKAPDNAVFPYATYSLITSNTYDESERKDIILSVDIWDNKDDTTALENLTDNVSNALNKNKVSSSTLKANIYLDGRFELQESDKQIRRRQLRFLITAYMY